jgi:aminoglycoside phosphotransferase (APT) family kinase protein
VTGPGTRIVSVRPLTGGTFSAVHALIVEGPKERRQRLVLRRYVRADCLVREPDLAEHEARVLRMLESSTVSAPGLVAVDPTGRSCDLPAVLMTRLRGRIEWEPPEAPQVSQAAGRAVAADPLRDRAGGHGREVL